MVNEKFLISYWTLTFSNALCVLPKAWAIDPVPRRAEFAPCMYELLPQQIFFFVSPAEASIAWCLHCPLLTSHSLLPPFFSFFFSPTWKWEANSCGNLSNAFVRDHFILLQSSPIALNAFSQFFSNFLIQFLVLETFLWVIGLVLFFCFPGSKEAGYVGVHRRHQLVKGGEGGKEEGSKSWKKNGSLKISLFKVEYLKQVYVVWEFSGLLKCSVQISEMFSIACISVNS